MSSTGFSRDSMWAVIKDWTRHSRSSVGQELHAMAERYERRKQLGLPQPVTEYILQQSQDAVAPKPAPPPTAPHAPEAEPGALVHDKA